MDNKRGGVQTELMHSAHSHAHGHSHAHAPATNDRRYTIAIGINLTFVAIEVTGGFVSNSTALLSDAVHNLSDVLGLALAGGASWLARQSAGTQHTYGYSKATVLAALANALLLVGASGGILWEAFKRLMVPQSVDAILVMGVAAAGVIINAATALLFVQGRKEDVNVRGAFLHMAQDAAISGAVIIAALMIYFTAAWWLDPVLSIIVVGLIAWSTWGLLKESLSLALDAAPAHIDVDAVRDFLAKQSGVTAVHDLHVWAMAATEPALTAHLVRPDGSDDVFLASLAHDIENEFGIKHVTLQIEREHQDCHAHP